MILTNMCRMLGKNDCQNMGIQGEVKFKGFVQNKSNILALFINLVMTGDLILGRYKIKNKKS